MNGIRRLREKKGMSIQQLAELSDSSVGVIHRLETGGVKIYHSLVPKLAAILECRMQDILFENSQEDSDETPSQEWASSEFNSEAIQHIPKDINEKKYLEMMQREHGHSIELWKVLSTTLKGIGVNNGDIVAISVADKRQPEMGDPVIIRVRKDGQYLPVAGALLRQFIEPDLFITNAPRDNKPSISRLTHDTLIIGVLKAKLFSFC